MTVIADFSTIPGIVDVFHWALLRAFFADSTMGHIPPRYRSVVSTHACPTTNWICSHALTPATLSEECLNDIDDLIP